MWQCVGNGNQRFVRHTVSERGHVAQGGKRQGGTDSLRG